MNPAARLNAALEILEKIETSRIPMDATVGDYMRFRRYIGSKDRAEVADRVYTMMRSRARIGWWLTKLAAEDTPRNRLIAHLMLQHGFTIDKLHGVFTGDKFAPAPLTEEEIELAKSLEGKDLTTSAMPDAVAVECPPEHEAALRGFYKDNFREELTAMLSAAPLDLRVNFLALDREQAQNSLAKDNVETDPAPLCPWTLRARSKAFLSDTKAFTKGHVEIQDEGSQLIAYLCDAQPGSQVLDYCAGAGGKTLAIVNSMNIDKRPKGRIVAMDIEASRLEKARPRFRRAHAHDIIEVRPLSDEKSRKWLKRQKQTFDVVLTDVPCSGTGTWRRNPDMRWRHYGPTLDQLLVTQAEILDKVAVAVKPGGRLVYATCSLLPAENEEQIEKFLSRHPEFVVMPIAEAWPDKAGPSMNIGENFMRLSPLKHNTDGFFAAVLQRTGTPVEKGLPIDFEEENAI